MAKSAVREISRDSAKWESARAQALQRDQRRCQYCRKTEAYDSSLDLQVHHIKPVSEGGTHDLENLVTLCNKCHWRLHNNFESEEYLRPELLNEYEAMTVSPKVGRPDVEDLRGAAPEIVELLRANGPMQLKNIIKQTGYSRGYIQNELDSLRFGNFVCRVERGVYAYISTIQHRKMIARGENERGDYRVRVWDPGEQITLTDCAERAREVLDDA